jgi:hypothetical protein
MAAATSHTGDTQFHNARFDITSLKGAKLSPLIVYDGLPRPSEKQKSS